MRRDAGMTLVELLAAMAIFLGLAGMVLQVLSGGLNLWSEGEATRENTDHASLLLDRLTEELRHSLTVDQGQGLPRIRFHCDAIRQDANRDGAEEFRAQRLLFVRQAFEERTHPLLREAGRRDDVGQYFFSGLPPEVEGEPPAYRATEGMAEVAFLALPDVRQDHPGRMVLWRALRTPIGGDGSLFESLEESDGGLRQVPMESLAENLLYLGFEFLEREPDDSLDTGEPLVNWDSTRGWLSAGDSVEAFRYARDPSSLIDADDDIFPRAVRITLVVTTPPGQTPVANLTQELPNTAENYQVTVRNGRFLRDLGEGTHLLKIGHEWVEVAAPDGRGLQVLTRGLRGTLAVTHPEGTPVQVGRTYRRTVLLPGYREYLNDQVSSS